MMEGKHNFSIGFSVTPAIEDEPTECHFNTRSGSSVSLTKTGEPYYKTNYTFFAIGYGYAFLKPAEIFLLLK